MRIYVSQEFCDKFNNLKKLDIDACFRMEQIGFMIVYDSIPGEIRIEFSLAECNHISEIYSIFRRLEADRKQRAVLPLIEHEPIQKQFPFWDSGQYELFKLAA